jgi:ribonuclease Z
MNPLHNPGRPTTLTLGGLTLTGFAVSAVASYVMAPSLKAVFDLGHAPVDALSLDNVLLSHVHKDHVGGLPLYLSLREMQGMGPARVYVPMESRQPLLDFLAVFDRMEGPVVTNREKEVIGVVPGDVFALGRNKVRVFGASHRLPSVGYTVVDVRSKLRAEHVGKDPNVIRDMRLRGDTIVEVVERDLFTYVGDSTLEVSVKYGHTHLDELAELYARDPKGALAAEHIVLKHFSMRYEVRDIQMAVAGLPDGLRERVTVLMTPPTAEE